MVDTKNCSNPECPNENPQPVGNFGVNNSAPSGRAYYCRTCAYLAQRKYKEAHPEQTRKWRRAYVERNKLRNQQRVANLVD